MTRIQIIDDDHWCGEAIVAHCMHVASQAKYKVITEPEHSDGWDIYIVDNEFGGDDHGVDIVRRIRSRNPHAMIIMCTATQERVDVVRAMNLGCNGMICKGTADGREQMLEMIRRYMDTRCESASKPSIGAVFSDIKSIVTAWNTRVAQDEFVHAQAAKASAA